MGLRRLRQRLDGLESHSHQTLNKADQATGLIKVLIEDLSDGVNIEIGVKPTGIPLIDSVLEKWGWKLPFTFRIDPREETKP